MDSKKHSDRSECPIGYALDVFGDRWTLLILRDLLLKKRTRFRELMGMEEGIASNILSDRLKRLEGYGVIERRPDPNDGRQSICRPTETGVALIPSLLEISYWGVLSDGNEALGWFTEEFERDRDGMIRRFVAQHDEA